MIILRLLYARAGIPHCPICGREVAKQSAQEIVEAIEQLPAGARLLILSPLVRGRKGTHQAVLDEIRKAGFVRARVDGEVHELDGEIQMDRYKIHTIEAVVDRLVIQALRRNRRKPKLPATRLTDSVETALKFGDGYLTMQWLNPQADSPDRPPDEGAENNQEAQLHGKDLHFSEHLACPEHGSVLPEIEPRTFSFNTPHGACPDCQGLGGRLEIDPDLLIPDPDLSLNEGAIVASEWRGPREEGGIIWQTWRPSPGTIRSTWMPRCGASRMRSST